MFKKLFLTAIVALILFNSGHGQAQVIINPESDFVKSASKTPDFYYLPRGEELYKLTLDLYGDGKPVVFLTFKSWGSRTGNVWIAYAPVQGGYTLVKDATGAEGIVFRPKGFYSVDPKGGLFVLISGRDGGDLVHYDIKNGISQMKKLQVVDYGKLDDKKYVENILSRKLEDHSSEDHPAYKILTVSEIEGSK